MKDLLGGKGAGLAEMTIAGLPTPPGFTITTEACNDYFAAGERLPDGLWDDVQEAMREVERQSGKGFGDARNPLLVSVRSGAKFSMPGMMDTVLNLGLNEETLNGLIALTDNERFGWDAYRRFIQMFGRIVMDVKGERFDHALEERKERHGDAAQDTDLDVGDLRALVDEFKAIVKADTGRDFPTDPNEQLDLAIKAVFASWFGQRARDYRKFNKIADDLGTAVNVVTMVFGNMGDDSGTGVAFTRDPNTGEKVLYGEYLTNAQGEDVVAGIRTAPKIAQMATDMPGRLRRVPADRRAARAATTGTSRTSSSRSSGAACTCSRPAPRSGPRRRPCRSRSTWSTRALIGKREAVDRIEPAHVEQLLRRPFDPAALKAATEDRQGPQRVAGRRRRPGGVRRRRPRSSGSNRGEKVDPRPDRDVARRLPRDGGHPGDHHRPWRRDLARRGRRPPDRQAVRGRLGRPRGRLRDKAATCAVTGIDVQGRRLGQPRRHDRRACTSARCRRSRPGSRTSPSSRRSSAGRTRSAGWASGRTPTSPRRPPRRASYGAQGIGLCRTEHMFREGERLEIVRGAILVANSATRAKAKAAAGEHARRRRAARPSRRSTRRWASSRSSSRATSRASSGRWTACRSSSGSSTRRSTSSCRTSRSSSSR